MTKIMGILNVTPDSFSDGGRFVHLETAVDHALQMVKDGATVIDVGGESTRPGADLVSEEDEIKRVVPVIEALVTAGLHAISIDTRKSRVADAALTAGATMLNDVSGLTFDANMVSVAANADVPVCVMHMIGDPKTMQSMHAYEDVVGEVCGELSKRAAWAISEGVDPSKIILDPGIGFGKTLEHNLALIRNIGELRAVGFPVLVGPSRKRFIGELTGRDPSDRTSGTAAVVAYLAEKNVEYVRVHDIAACVDAIAVGNALRTSD